MKKFKSEYQYKKELEERKSKAPRSGVYPTKVIPDKTKYSRKIKHKKRGKI